MSRLIITLIAFVCGASLGLADSSSDRPVPRPEDFYNDFTYSFDGMSFRFDKGIKLLKNPKVYIRCKGKKILSANKIEVSNHRSKEMVEGTLTARFDEIYLPKGKDYEVVVAPGSIAYEDSTIPNKEFYRTLKVPSTLGVGRVDRENDTISYITDNVYHKLPTFFWGIETKAIGNPAFILYREGVPVRKIPAAVGYDWNLGQAFPNLDRLERNSKDVKKWSRKILMRFEKGVRYSIVLPAGSVSSEWRNDVVNETSVYNFIGGYDKEIPPLTYTDSTISISPKRKLESLDLVFTIPVAIAPEAKCQLRNIDNGKILKEVKLTVKEEGNSWNVSADFRNYKLKSGIDYTLVIPEGSITASTGDPVVNSSYNFPIQY